MKFFRKSAFSSATCLQGAAFAVALVGLPGVAQAQDAAPTNSAQCADENANGVCDSDEKKSDLVVTGSRLTRPTLSSPTPLTSVSVAELTDRGSVSLGNSLNNLPSLRSTFSSGNSTRFIGTAGLNVLDLRGLGTSRTLVLVNGKRHITASPGDYLVDVNTIPVDLLERVDIVTGGNSAIYGSDAVAGVVNFILKRDFDGLSIKGQGAISSRGDRGSYFVSGTWGKNFADGRGNIAVSGEYARAEPLYFRDRDYLTGAYSGRCQFQLVDNTAGEPNGTDGIFDNEFVCGVRNAAISDGGTVGALDPSTSATRRYLRFDSNGMPFIDTPNLSYAPVGSGNQNGGQGSTLRNTGMLLAGVERYTANLLFHYDFSDAFQFFLEGKYVHVWANQEGQPSFLNSGPQSVGGPQMRCSNGFLSAAALASLQSFGLCATPSTGRFNLARFNIDFGGRGEIHKRDTYRIVAGWRGTFNDDWNYEFAVNYGRLETHQRSLNNLKLFDTSGNPDGFNLAVDAVLAPVGYTGTNYLLNSAGQKVICAVNSASNVRPDCVPINILGYGAPSAASLAFVNTEARREERAEEFDVTFNIAGDLSQLFELPGGPIGWSLGSEYREEIAHSSWDALTASGGTFLNAIQPFNPPKQTVKEVYGELDLPLLKDMPFAKELSVRGAGRMSDYNTSTGTVWAWNIDGIYAPVSDIRFRAAYSTSVRAPTQSDLYTSLSQNFATIGDPCNSANIGSGSSFRAANCLAAGVPVTYNAATVAACASTAFTGTAGVTPWRNCTARTSSTGYQSGGNPALVAERGKSLTLGVVIEPHWIPGLNFTVDWYRIRVTNLISTLGAQAMLNACYDSPSLANQYCATVNRDPSTGLFVYPAVQSIGRNFAKQETNGIDFDLSYRKTFANGQKLSLRAIATRVVILDNYLDPANPTLPNRQLGELGDPLWAAGLTFNYDFGAVDFTYSARYQGKQTVGAWEAQNRYTGFCPASGNTGLSGRACTPGELTLLDPQNADQFSHVFYPAAVYQNVRLNFELPGKKYAFYLGVDNFMDKKPPLGLLGTAGGDDYDTVGRYFYAGFKINM